MFKNVYTNRFCFRNLQSPTLYNINRYLLEQGWCPTRFNWIANFHDHHLEFDLPAAETLEFKHLLAQLISQHCPKVMPETYWINDQNWSSVLNLIAKKYYKQENLSIDQVENLNWILKPALLNNGQHIKIFQTLSQLEQHYLSGNRMGGEHVLQQYLTKPHLLGGHKYTIRMFVVVTNYAGAYLYPHGYFNVARQLYQADDFSDLSSHLTNEHLDEHESNVIQIPTSRMDIFTTLYQPIKDLITGTINALRQQHPQAFIENKQRALAIFGFDFLVDSDKCIWLLEANHGPCFPTSDDHPLQKHLYYDFWQALIANFVIPIAQRIPKRQIQYQLFDPVKWVR